MGARQGIPLVDQSTGDLGCIVCINPFVRAFDSGYRSVVVIGTDLPTVNSELLRRALKELSEYDLVVGPSVDGGYYLIGLNQPHEELFVDIPWSTDAVLSCTRDKGQKTQSISQAP